ncbi:MAG: hypothetical protein ACRDV9_11675 [Acidimicrobiia bacterium]
MPDLDPVLLLKAWNLFGNAARSVGAALGDRAPALAYTRLDRG